MSDKTMATKTKKDRSSVRSDRVMDFVAKILCLVGAFLIWFYAVSADVITLERDFNVPIRFEHETDLFERTGWSVLSGKDSNIVVTLKGKRDIINKITESDIVAFVDLANVESSGRQTLDIKVSAPTECEIVNMSVSSISPYIDKKVTRNVPVKVDLFYDIISGDKLESEMNLEEIAITGPESEIKNVSAAKAELKLGNVTQTVNAVAELKLVNEKNESINSVYISMSTNKVNVTARLYTEKTVPLKVDYKHGYFNEKNVKISIEPSTVTLKGESSVLRGIDSINVATLDEKKYVTNSTQNVAIALPEGVSLVSAETSAVINIEHIGTVTKQITVKNIKLENAGGLDVELQTEALNIIFRGPYGLLSRLTEDNIEVIVDMKNTTGTGTSVIPVTIRLLGEFAGEVYELDNYSVTVNVK